MLAHSPCPLCQQGQIGFRLCSDRETVVLVCEECGYVWVHPARVEASQAYDPLDPAFARRHPECSLRPSRWAEAAQVEAFGWGAYLLRPEELLAPPEPEKS